MSDFNTSAVALKHFIGAVLTFGTFLPFANLVQRVVCQYLGKRSDNETKPIRTIRRSFKIPTGFDYLFQVLDLSQLCAFLYVEAFLFWELESEFFLKNTNLTVGYKGPYLTFLRPKTFLWGLSQKKNLEKSIIFRAIPYNWRTLVMITHNRFAV